MIATLKLLTPYPLRLKVKLNALSVGSRIGLLEPMFGKMLKTLEMPKQSLTVRFITIDKLTQSLRKSLTFVFKKLSKKVNLCSVNLKYLFLFQSPKDIFCLRTTRVIDAYRRISLNGLQLKLNAAPREPVILRIYPLNGTVSEVRFWCHNKLIDVQKVKINAI